MTRRSDRGARVTGAARRRQLDRGGQALSRTPSGSRACGEARTWGIGFLRVVFTLEWLGRSISIASFGGIDMIQGGSTCQDEGRLRYSLR
jgi:hypothetical protein